MDHFAVDLKNLKSQILETQIVLEADFLERKANYPGMSS